MITRIKMFRMICGFYVGLIVFVICFSFIKDTILCVYHGIKYNTFHNPFETLIDILEAYIKLLKDEKQSIWYKLAITALIVLGIIGIFEIKWF